VKVILIALCGIMVLFSGGCALILFTGSGYNGMFQTLPGALIFGGITALNLLVLAALLGKRKPQSWAFHTLGGLDVIAVIVLALMWSGFGTQDSEVNVIGSVLIGGFALKAALTFFYASRLGRV
jgi:hypothetical protein